MSGQKWIARVCSMITVTLIALTTIQGCERRPQSAPSESDSSATAWPSAAAEPTSPDTALITRSSAGSLIDVASVSLGDSVAQSPASPSSLVFLSNSIVVVDRTGRAVLEYDRQGRFLRRLRKAPGVSLSQPIDLIEWRDTAFLLDITASSRLFALTPDGLQPRLRDTRHALHAAISGAGDVFLTRSITEHSATPIGFVARAKTLGDTSARSFCLPSQKMKEAYASGTALSSYQGIRIAILDSVLFCAQPTEGRIRRYTLDGAPLAPYTRVNDQFSRLDQMPTAEMKDIRVAKFSGTAISNLWPFPNGIGLSYYDFNASTKGRNIALVAVCDSSRGPISCTHARTGDEVLQFVAPDTFWLFRESVGRTPPRIIAAQLTRGR